MKNNGFQKDRRSHTVLTVVFTIIAIAYLYPIFIVLVNSLKSNAAINLDTFAFPASDTFMGLQNYIKGMTFGNYPFYRSVEYSLMITLLSSALILICTSMAAWYISRVDSLICRVVYYLCVFSMVVPFQMVMFTLAKTADTLKLNRPWTIPIIYLGFGAGLAVFNLFPIPPLDGSKVLFSCQKGRYPRMPMRPFPVKKVLSSKLSFVLFVVSSICQGFKIMS